jgi:hypothetical protein
VPIELSVYNTSMRDYGNSCVMHSHKRYSVFKLSSHAVVGSPIHSQSILVSVLSIRHSVLASFNLATLLPTRACQLFALKLNSTRRAICRRSLRRIAVYVKWSSTSSDKNITDYVMSKKLRCLLMKDNASHK